MALNGQQKADDNLLRFQNWVANKSDSDFSQIVSRGSLNRREIATECGFARSVVDQNPRVRQALLELETRLRDTGVLPQKSEATEATEVAIRATSDKRAQLDAERLRRLEQENALLRSENQLLKDKLNQYATLAEVLAETGRIPR